MKYVLKRRSVRLAMSALDAVGYFISRIKGRLKTHRVFEGPKSLLVIRMDHIGDVLLATAVPKRLKENFPDASVYFLTSSWAAPLLENNPFVDEVLIYDAPWFLKKGHVAKRKGLGFFALAWTIRKKNISVGIGLRGDLRENFLMAISNIKRRIGYGITGGGFFLTDEVVYERKVHEVVLTAKLLEPLGIRDAQLSPQMTFTRKEEEHFARAFPSLEKGAAYRVGIQIGAGTKAKEWPGGYWEVFLRRLLKGREAIKIFLVGSDIEKAGRLTKTFAKGSLTDLTRRTSLREAGLLMRHLHLFIGPDSGPTHIAAVLGVPTIFLYSGTNNFEQWKPLTAGAVILRKEVPCAPCGLEKCPVPGHPCMANITPDELLAAVENSLGINRRL